MATLVCYGTWLTAAHRAATGAFARRTHFWAVPRTSLAPLSVARVNATPRRLSRGKGGTARGRLGLGHLDRGLAVLGTRSSEVASLILIEHLPCRGRDARHCEPSEVKVDNGARRRGRFGRKVARTIGGDAPVP